jgi:hypothetical protein
MKLEKDALKSWSFLFRDLQQAEPEQRRGKIHVDHRLQGPPASCEGVVSADELHSPLPDGCPLYK